MTMRLFKLGLLTKITGAILAIIIVTSVTMFAIQHVLYSKNFDSVVAGLEDSALQMKRESARDILAEVKIATETRLDPRPRSAVSTGVGLVGLAGLFAWVAVSRALHPGT